MEQTIEVLERLLSGSDYEIKSPESVADIDTGIQREVDVTIRGSVGSSEVFGIVECRDRNAKQDVRWIEEIASKVQSVGADFGIAVSSSGFTDGAVRKGERLRIRLRTLKALESEDISEWFSCKDYRCIELQLKNLRVGIIPSREAGEGELPGFEELSDSDSVLRVSESGKLITKSELLQIASAACLGMPDMEKVRSSPGYKDDLEIGETWESQPTSFNATLPTDVPVELVSGLPVAAISLQCDQVVLVTRMPFSFASKVVDVNSGETRPELGAVGMISQQIGDKTFRIWAQSDGKGQEAMSVQIDKPSRAARTEGS